MKLIPTPRTLIPYGAALLITGGLALATAMPAATVEAMDPTPTVTATMTNPQGGQTPVPGGVVRPTTAANTAATSPAETLAAPAPSAAPVASARPTPLPTPTAAERARGIAGYTPAGPNTVGTIVSPSPTPSGEHIATP